MLSIYIFLMLDLFQIDVNNNMLPPWRPIRTKNTEREENAFIVAEAGLKGILSIVQT